MKIRDIIEMPFKAEILVLHAAYSVGAFFMVLPSIGPETSGSKKGPLLKAWEKGFHAIDRAFSKFQVGQMKLLHKLGLLRDDEFIGKRLESYFHNLEGRNAGPEARIDLILSMNKSGFLSDLKTAKMLGEAGHSSDLSFTYDPARKSFGLYRSVTDAQEQEMTRAWDKMIGWASAKSEDVAKLQGKARADFASAIVYALDMTPLGSTEDAVIAIGPRASMQHSLAIVFKQAVDGTGQPFAATAYEAGTVAELAQELESGPRISQRRQYHPNDEIVTHAAQTAVFLKGYAPKA